MAKICKLIRQHSFEDIRIFEKEAMSLRKLGHEVTIVTGKFNGYVFGPDLFLNQNPEFQKDHFIYRDIHFLTYDIQHYTLSSSHIIGMIKNLLEDKQDYFVDKLYETALSTNADVYHAHEWQTLYEAVQIKKTLRKKGKHVKVIFDAHELESDNLLLTLLMKEVDHLITVSDSIKEIYEERYPEIPITLIYNSPYYQDEITMNKDKESFTIAYEGVLTSQKGDPERILDIANLCNTKMTNFHFVIFGRMPEFNEHYKLMYKKIRENPSIILRWVKYHDLPKEYQTVHIGYIFFDTKEQNRMYALPNKFFSYLNNGVPVVVNHSKEMKNFIEKHECGIVIDKAEPTAEDYVEAFLKLYEDRELLSRMSKKGREAMQKIYCWQKMEERLAEVYNSLI